MPFGHCVSLLLLCLLCDHLTAGQRSDFVQTIEPYSYTNWGSWGNDEWCPQGQYAYGFRAKVEPMQGGGDDTGLNGIRLLCKAGTGHDWGTRIESNVGLYGSWTYTRRCDCNRFLSTVSLRSEPNQGSGKDDTAANNLNFKCEDGNWIYGSGTPWGNWNEASCPAGSVICGIKTMVEGAQGNGDDTSLNRVKFHCCTAPSAATRGSVYSNCAATISTPNPQHWVPLFQFDGSQRCYPTRNHGDAIVECQTSTSSLSTTPVYYEEHKCSDNKIHSITYYVFFGASVSCPNGNMNHEYWDWEKVTLNFKQCDRKYCIDSITYYQMDGYYTRPYDYENERYAVNVFVGKMTNAFYHNTCCSNCDTFCSIFTDQCAYFKDFRDPGYQWRPRVLQSIDTVSGPGGGKRCDRNTCASQGCQAKNWDLYA